VIGTAAATAALLLTSLTTGHYTGTDAAASDMHGITASTYHGRYYTQAGEQFRRCVIHRESRGNYRAANDSGHHGGYQFNDAAWRVSLTHMMRTEHDQLRATAVQLRALPINRWPRYWQDRAFFTALNYHAPFSGWRHWHLTGSPCNALAQP